MTKIITEELIEEEFGAFYAASRVLCDAEELIPPWNELPPIVKQSFVQDVVATGLDDHLASVLDRTRLVYSSQVN